MAAEARDVERRTSDLQAGFRGVLGAQLLLPVRVAGASGGVMEAGLVVQGAGEMQVLHASSVADRDRCVNGGVKKQSLRVVYVAVQLVALRDSFGRVVDVEIAVVDT